MTYGRSPPAPGEKLTVLAMLNQDEPHSMAASPRASTIELFMVRSP
ncbi:hypothetical protein [Luteibacter sp.]|jgi:hypothetical protein